MTTNDDHDNSDNESETESRATGGCETEAPPARTTTKDIGGAHGPRDAQQMTGRGHAA